MAATKSPHSNITVAQINTLLGKTVSAMTIQDVLTLKELLTRIPGHLQGLGTQLSAVFE